MLTLADARVDIFSTPALCQAATLIGVNICSQLDAQCNAMLAHCEPGLTHAYIIYLMLAQPG